jgi:hypothetical protein
MMKRHWIILPVMALAVVSCGKPKPREVAELQLDGKAVELKGDALAAVRAQFGAVCEFADGVSERARERAQAAGASSVTQTLSKATAPASASVASTQANTGSRLKVSRSEQQSSGNDGAVTRTQTVLAWDATLPDELRKLGQATGKTIDSQAVSGLTSRLDGLRSGWSAAAYYHSDTAPLDALKSFDRYTYQQVKFTPASLECVRESSERSKPRR